MQQSKPRNYIALALIKRNGAGAHEKTTKAKRAQAKRQLMKELKSPPKIGGFFIINKNLPEYNLVMISSS